ncbi:vWA domain-containing protein [Bythopirellula polymerisocia]|uniref:von Willebrand factor type A domain protein n=1 Tax=Bythopirellula polymerisocia TaxID=2528003 RepID=A0A5C6CUB3_9BACT|nr:vWA domain-containing protein [Bythopirellula polymerisocia]TWU27244.1 von Willebrand factor type A domain protein [Bythopirellula polymerisocia]
MMLVQSMFSAATGSSDVAREFVTWNLRRVDQFDDPRLLWFLLAVGVLLIIACVTWLYRRESVSLSPWLRVLFPVLRITAWLGAILFFLGLEKRIDQQVVSDSQVAILVDTSQSMSVADLQNAEGQSVSRGKAVEKSLKESEFLAALRQKHKVELITFDRESHPVASWTRTTLDPQLPQVEADNTEELDWSVMLEPRGRETRLGDALRNTLKKQRTGQLAGVIVITDGDQNTGVDALSLFDSEQRSSVPIYTVGIGSNEPRRNVRIQELNAPARVYPEDRTTINGIVQGEGFAGRSVHVQLFAREADSQNALSTLVEEKNVTFTDEQQVVPVEFEIEPAAIGSLILELKVVAPQGDQYAGDNRREVEVEVVEASTRVLLIAGGASRDYQFLRNQLFRDRHMQVDVWVQSATSGLSQEADQILHGFPQTKEELYDYDCIVAFDPNWEFLDARQVDLLESWVAEEAGGLIVVAGPIYTLSWSQSPEHAKIRSLYPVEFQRRLTLLDDGLYGSKTPWPILFTREGEEADFLSLTENAAESGLLWAEFPGVYGCYAVKGPKPGARVLGYYGDPDASITAEYPVYMAEQFYGGGRVFYLGSGELWRLRALDPSYFEVLTTRLIRHISQGRLLKGSTRGRLLVEQDRYTVGSEVIVRAQLLAASREPLLADSVLARVVGDQGKGQKLLLKADKSRPGNFIGQFTVNKAGSFRIELAVPDTIDDLLVRRIQAILPDLEFENPQRNDELLSQLAKVSKGKYYTSLDEAILGENDSRAIDELIESRAETRIIHGTPDRDFTEWLNKILLGVICGALCLEWLLRRLMKLA